MPVRVSVKVGENVLVPLDVFVGETVDVSVMVGLYVRDWVTEQVGVFVPVRVRVIVFVAVSVVSRGDWLSP